MSVLVGVALVYVTYRWLLSLWTHRRRPKYTYWWDDRRRPRRHHHERR